MISCLRTAVIAGVAGGLAMVPVGLTMRLVFGTSVNVYGELVVLRIAGRLDPVLLAAEHLVVSVVMALPLICLLERVGYRSAIAIGSLYGGSAWLIVNALVLPMIFDRPSPWEIGPSAIWGSLIVHLVFGLVVALVARRLAAVGRPSPA
jgi:uncharacterized membrane protein YagU involved in acid resistance